MLAGTISTGRKALWREERLRKCMKTSSPEIQNRDSNLDHDGRVEVRARRPKRISKERKDQSWYS